MSAAVFPSEPCGLQRARGEVRLAFRRRGPATALAVLHQAGCLKARLPRPSRLGWAEAVLLNSSGGVAGGDTLDCTVTAEAGAQVTVCGQAAERYYRARAADAPARVRNSLLVAAGSTLEWLPQDSILFDGAALDRRLEIAIAGDARLLAVESLVFGRKAMGEVVRRGRLRDTIRLVRDGRLLLHDALRLEGDMAAALDHAAVGGGARAAATVLRVAPGVGAVLDAARAALSIAGVEAGASCRDGMLIARVLAPDGAALRHAVVALLAVLRDGAALPRIWAV